MSVAGLCHVCEAAPGKHTCGHCGRVVCSDHWESPARACVDCATDASDPDRPDGVGLDG
ncbi:hypothetical protein [Halorubrum sp. JWXQ-INN 858]|uniref:hypothetical protein n=1 Tax=Halorubrum sp. JWXQ-INN 858 TaxID=2690782 RepID=UPI00190F73E7|nr:hypothetical protein [Halorubrum sp. JWXQ-INN 858]